MRNQLIYDLPMRIFHWLFAGLFIAAFLIAKNVDDESPVFSYHMLVGLLLGFTVLMRILWGFVGTKHSKFTSFALHPKDLVMIWFLIGIGSVFVLTGEIADGITLFVAVLPLLFMDAFLHWRTQASTASLKGQMSSHVKVKREVKDVVIDSRELVPGDVLIVEPGILLPADGIFEVSQDIQIDESALTGESLPIKKNGLEVDLFSLSFHKGVRVPSHTLGFAGTKVLTGSGLLRVTLTGTQTAYGEIVHSVSRMPQERTPLQKSIYCLVQILIFIAMALLTVWSAGLASYLTGFRSQFANILSGLIVLSSAILIQMSDHLVFLHLTPLHLKEWIITGLIVVFIISALNFLKRLPKMIAVK